MKEDDDRVESARIAREISERNARWGHPGSEDTDPPPRLPPPRPRMRSLPMFPPEPVEDRRVGAGIPHSDPPIARAHKSLDAAWKIVLVIVGALTLGWSAHAFFTKPLTLDAVSDGNKPIIAKIEELRKEQEVNQRSNETTFAGIAKDIEWLKSERKVVESEPIKHQKERQHVIP